jgi:hypothetical protein
VSNFTTLRHCTPARNLPWIFRRGLSPAFAKGRLRCIWLHSPSRSGWAAPHVAARHFAEPSGVIFLSVRVPRAWLRRHGRGSWFCTRPIPSSCIVSVLHPLAVPLAG